MSISMAIDATQIVSLIGDLEEIEKGIKKFKDPLTNSVKQVVAPSIGKNFEVGGRPPWDPLSEVTIQMRSQQGIESTDILVATGNLKREATSMQMWTITDTEATVASLPASVWYGALQDQGFSTSRNTVPARPFLIIQEEDIDGMVSVFDEWLGTLFHTKGFA